jgi:hypothetical protein
MKSTSFLNRKSARTITFRTFTFFLWITFITSVVPAQRAITNPSIELPAFANGTFYQAAEGTVPGWLTSHPVQPAACGGVNCRPIERWSTGFSGVSPATGAGLRWAELNAFQNSMIYQSVCMTNGESFGYSFVHRGRGSATVADVAQFRLGIPTLLPAGSKPADTYSFPIATVSTESDGGGAAPTAFPNATVAAAAGGNGWRRYSGTFAYTGTTQIVNIGYVAISSAGGGASGNFIDDWQITLSPYLEFSPASTSGPEGTSGGVGGGSNTPANSPAFRIGGNLSAAATITFQVTGGSATIGNDYSLTVPFAAGNTTPTATVTIPAGTYDGVSAASLFPIPFSIRSDVFPEPDETVTFAITAAPGTTIASITGCGTPPVTTSTYTITNDDIVTAAPVIISGQVLDLGGRPIMNARLRLTSTTGDTYSAHTNPFGYFVFDRVPSGTTYVLETSAKGHSFEAQTMSISDDVTGLVITPTEQK